MAIAWFGQTATFFAILRPTGDAGTGDAGALVRWAGLSWAAALLLVGLPVALVEPRKYLPDRKSEAIAMAAIVGAVAASAQFWGFLTTLTAPTGLVAGAVAMWLYTAMISGSPEVFGEPRDTDEEGPTP